MTLIGVRVITQEELEHRVWALVELNLSTAEAMNFDGCHKIYLSMDDPEVQQMVRYGYEDVKPDLALIRDWFEGSCGLRLIQAVHSNEANPNAGYIDLIPQGFGADEDDG